MRAAGQGLSREVLGTALTAPRKRGSTDVGREEVQNADAVTPEDGQGGAYDEDRSGVPVTRRPRQAECPRPGAAARLRILARSDCRRPAQRWLQSS